MEKSCPGQQGQAESTWASVYRRKKRTPFPEPRASRACSDRPALTELSRLDQPNCLYGKKVDSAKRVTLLVEPTFCFSCKWFVKFLTKCRKTCLAQDNLSRRVISSTWDDISPHNYKRSPRKRQQTLKWLLHFDWPLTSYDHLILTFHWFISA